MRALLFVVCLLSLLAAGAREARPVSICHYNLENFVGEDQVAQGKRRAKPKTEQQIEELVRIIKEMDPDILGVCEMGSRAQFVDFQGRLQKAGLGYVDSEYVEGPDPDRHLALLSRFPIVSRQSVTDVPFSLDGNPEKVRRGFLDVTVEIHSSYRLRLVGVHLKSKLAAENDEELIRRREAHFLRAHLDKILKEDPEVNLACYGDFNVLKNDPVFQEITGPRGSPGHMSDLWAKDGAGHRWTHYWAAADLYSRIDYILVNRGLSREVLRERAEVYASKNWSRASDHRPVRAFLIPVD